MRVYSGSKTVSSEALIVVHFISLMEKTYATHCNYELSFKQ